MMTDSVVRRHRFRRGLDLPLSGAPQQVIESAPAAVQVALLGVDHAGLKPSFHVQPGSRVLRGQLLFEDKATPGVRWTSPAAGTVSALHRGERRAFQSIVIEVDEVDDAAAEQVRFAALPRPGGDPPDGATLRALLLESGLWTALRTRPFSRVPAADGVPEAIFVTAIDTQPHAPDPQVALAGRSADFAAGMAAIEQLGPQRVLLCRAAGSHLGPGPGSRAEVHEFSGPHPAGTPGLHIHRLHPVDSAREVWHIGAQDVAAIGHLLLTGRLDVQRVVSLAGPGVLRPHLLRTRLGASLGELTRGALQPGPQRVLSGSVLGGRACSDDAHAFLGRFHLQISVLPEFEPAARQLFAGLRPGGDLFSSTRAFASALHPRRPVAMNTSTHGPHRPMLPMASHHRVWPFELEPVLLLRALLAGDTEQIELLGGLELDEEDLALATVVCPGKHDYGSLLRQALGSLQEMAT
jgi:Na+-transporting NADH:ubiquinone oxidoreductase subunit A